MSLTKTLLPVALCAAMAFAGAQPAASQTSSNDDNQGTASVDVSLTLRGDYQHSWVNGNDSVRTDDGFKANTLNLRVRGNITSKLAYDWHQAFKRRGNSDYDLINQTLRLYLAYTPVQQVTLTAGKQVVEIGGFEYDTAPTDVFVYSEWCGNLPCYQWGGKVELRPNASNRLSLQVTQSPFRDHWKNADTYSYNLLWDGRFGPYSALWSVNMVEWKQGEYINYLALGNQLQFDRWRVRLDLMNRATAHQKFLFKDCSVVGELRYTTPGGKVQLHGKYSYDVNHSGRSADLAVLDGTEMHSLSAGVEYFPLRDLRVHALYAHSWGENTNAAGLRLDREHLLNVGLTWNVGVFSRKWK